MRALWLTLLVWACASVAQAADYYATVAGNGPTCSIGTPCTLTQAVTNCNSGSIVGDDHVYVAAGTYSQAALTLSCSGTAGHPVNFHFAHDPTVYANNAILSAGREAVPVGDWTLTSGQTLVWEAPFNDTTKGWVPTTILQITPTTWTDIIVRSTPTSINRFKLTFPPNYGNGQASTAALALQGCNFRFDTSVDKIYVHPCDDLAPNANHNFYLRSSGWGGFTVSGDYITIDGLELEYANASGTAFTCSSTASNIILSNAYFKSAAVSIQCDDISMPGLRSESVGGQGVDTADPACYNANSPYGTGFCWNQNGSGSGISFTATASNVTISDCYIGKNWNNISATNPGPTNVTIHDCFLGDSQNHNIEMNGTGWRFYNNVCDNVQECIFMNETLSSMSDVEIYNNVMSRGPIFRGVDGPLSFHNNIVAGQIVYDAKAVAQVPTCDCNLIIPSVTGDDATLVLWGAAPGTPYTTLANVRTNTVCEDNGATLAYTAWHDGTQFVLFTGTDFEIVNFRPVSTSVTALNMPTCGTVGPYALDLTGSRLRLRRKL